MDSCLKPMISQVKASSIEKLTTKSKAAATTKTHQLPAPTPRKVNIIKNKNKEKYESIFLFTGYR